MEGHKKAISAIKFHGIITKIKMPPILLWRLLNGLPLFSNRPSSIHNLKYKKFSSSEIELQPSKRLSENVHLGQIFFQIRILLSNFSIFQYIYISPHEPNTNVVLLMQHFLWYAYRHILLHITIFFLEWLCLFSKVKKTEKNITKLNTFNSIKFLAILLLYLFI